MAYDFFQIMQNLPNVFQCLLLKNLYCAIIFVYDCCILVTVLQYLIDVNIIAIWGPNKVRLRQNSQLCPFPVGSPASLY